MADFLRTASVLSAAVGIALVSASASTRADETTKENANVPQVVKDNMARAAAKKLEKCYGINSVAKNDCSEGPHSCAGQATQPRELKSFVLVPAGDCKKIDGGKLNPG